MKVLVSGSHGLIGSALVAALARAGHEVVRLVRGQEGPGEASWDLAAGRIDRAPLEGLGAAVHLAGAPLGERRWTEEQKARLQDSRVDGTRLLAETLARLEPVPAVLISGSAVGYYGDRGDQVLDEESPEGSGFLAGLCAAWEGATLAAEEAGIRVVHLRSGIVQSRRGGALAKQLPLFRLGLGGRLGNGRQWLSWISLPDEVGAIMHALADPGLSGAVNATSPEPVTNADYTRTLARVMGRPAILAVPAQALSLALGQEMAAEMALVSQRVLPRRLEAAGYRFRHPNLELGLRAALAEGDQQ
jgi:uncharacterized protein (TIGR01777 family)